MLICGQKSIFECVLSMRCRHSNLLILCLFHFFVFLIFLIAVPEEKFFFNDQSRPLTKLYSFYFPTEISRIAPAKFPMQSMFLAPLPFITPPQLLRALECFMRVSGRRPLHAPPPTISAGGWAGRAPPLIITSLAQPTSRSCWSSQSAKCHQHTGKSNPNFYWNWPEFIGLSVDLNEIHFQ